MRIYLFLSISLTLGCDIILYDSHLAVYKHSLNLILYFIARPTENDLMISAALTSLTDALTMLLWNSLEKRGVLKNLDLVLLCLDETIDNGWVLFHLPSLSLSVVRLTQVGFLRIMVHRCHSHRFPRPQTMPRHDGNSH